MPSSIFDLQVAPIWSEVIELEASETEPPTEAGFSGLQISGQPVIGINQRMLDR